MSKGAAYRHTRIKQAKERRAATITRQPEFEEDGGPQDIGRGTDFPQFFSPVSSPVRKSIVRNPSRAPVPSQ